MTLPTFVRSAALTALALSALLALPGCLPQRFVIDLRPGEDLVESTVIADKDAGRSGPSVALIHVDGFLADARIPGLIGASPNSVDQLVARLEAAEADPNVRAVVLRINSPGGTVTGSAIMAREVRLFADRSHKPVVASMGEMATSGGFYLSVAADTIYAEPTTITGSIGVIMQTFNFSSAMDRFGIHARAVTSGPNKDLASPFAPERDEQYQILQGMVNDYYAGFKSWVISRRPAFDPTKSAFAMDGRVITGAAAKDLGLVDNVGGVREAYAEAKRRANLTSARLVTFHSSADSPKTPYAAAANAPAQESSASANSTINFMQINAPGLLSTAGLGAGFYYLWVPPGQ